MTEQNSHSDNDPNIEDNQIDEVLTKLEEAEETRGKMEDQLLKTIKYTGETNKKVMDVLGTLMTVVVEQQKLQKSQHKNNKMKLLIWAMPVFFMLFYMGKQAYDEQQKYKSPTGYVAQVSITGTIEPGSPTASADAVIPALRKAFEDKAAKGVLIKISSPGGSPAQAHLIYKEIKRLQSLYPDKKMALIGTDSLTSGAMWIAAAAPKINVLESTYTGSIGVIVSQFNFGKAIKNYDIERLIITSGTNKSVLDTFVPPKQKDIAKIEEMASQIHKQFKQIMVESRGDRLNANHELLFSGEFWLGKEAVELGLADKVTTTTELLLEEFETVDIRDYSSKPGLLDKISLSAQALLSTPQVQSMAIRAYQPLASFD
ncbi:S49 family peptidase [Alteromonas sp. BZK5]|jgi:protease IV|uniref:S49 family peptidase n=1 Tax=Alteromonas sp. BZK5 TaxID=1904459 RepID=UPI001653BC8F|nr:S49 family peptidase [Alteromonas sp. BZK5]MBC6987780.1 S49 family peptidase [Alteromonas sp. BZK5]